MADAAIEALSTSRVRDVSILGRRGVVQAAFTTVEVKELGELTAAGRRRRSPRGVRSTRRAPRSWRRRAPRPRPRSRSCRSFAQRVPTDKPRRLRIRFLVVAGRDPGRRAAARVTGLKLVKNELVKTEGGIVAQPDGRDRDAGRRPGVPLGRLPRRAAPELPLRSERHGHAAATTRVGCWIPRLGNRCAATTSTGWIKRGSERRDRQQQGRFGGDGEHADRGFAAAIGCSRRASRSGCVGRAAAAAPAAARDLRRLASELDRHRGRARPSAGASTRQVHLDARRCWRPCRGSERRPAAARRSRTARCP